MAGLGSAPIIKLMNIACLRAGFFMSLVATHCFSPKCYISVNIQV
ncbi:hypothetical protein W04_2778 [Pseudoalteromonas sp. SW0106-04]|nr:hypothetical protein W04_2778 [Pseudoalteromonas sp. SW0106-04]